MKFLLLFCLLGIATRAAEKLDAGRLYDCLCLVEGGDPKRLGGAACLSFRVWRDRTVLPYALSRDPVYARRVGLWHLAWLRDTMHTEDPATLALAWRWGIDGLRHHPHDDYGQRVANLYRENSL